MHRLSGWRRARRPTHRTRRTAGPFLLAGLAFAATVVALPGTSTARPDIAGPESVPAASWDRDALRVAATKDVPTFGGAYLDKDGSTLYVWLTRPTVDGALRSRNALATAIGPQVVGDGTPDPIVHRADYTFAQLKDWHDAMTALLALPGVTMMDIDERANRLMVAVEDSGRDGPAVTAGLARLGVPRAAVTLAQSGPVTPTLGDRTRPLRAGTQIQSTRGLCTLGFVAQRAGVTGFVTNSHCSATNGVVDSGRYWQPTIPADASDAVGVETVDPAFFTDHPSCPVGRRCRNSDANFVATLSGVGIGQGQIARPPMGSTNWNGTDTFRVTAIGGTRLTDTVQKVGRSTGRTTGTVTADCIDTNPANTNITLFCQDMASYQVNDGDSGSPVFVVTNAITNTVSLVGIHWGITSVGGAVRGLYSPFTGVESELGNLSVCADVTVC